jgi:hypothetical protein
MKFWEVLSAFRDRQDILQAVLSSERWRDPYHAWLQNKDELIRSQNRAVLDSLVPFELSRQIAAQFDHEFLYSPGSGNLQSAAGAVSQEPTAIRMTALEVLDRFGGAVIEEVFEFGSVKVERGGQP